jgi:hypothetical protein
MNSGNCRACGSRVEATPEVASGSQHRTGWSSVPELCAYCLQQSIETRRNELRESRLDGERRTQLGWYFFLWILFALNSSVAVYESLGPSSAQAYIAFVLCVPLLFLYKECTASYCGEFAEWAVNVSSFLITATCLYAVILPVSPLGLAGFSYACAFLLIPMGHPSIHIILKIALFVCVALGFWCFFVGIVLIADPTAFASFASFVVFSVSVPVLAYWWIADRKRRVGYYGRLYRYLENKKDSTYSSGLSDELAKAQRNRIYLDGCRVTQAYDKHVRDDHYNVRSAMRSWSARGLVIIATVRANPIFTLACTASLLILVNGMSLKWPNNLSLHAGTVCSGVTTAVALYLYRVEMIKMVAILATYAVCGYWAYLVVVTVRMDQREALIVGILLVDAILLVHGRYRYRYRKTVLDEYPGRNDNAYLDTTDLEGHLRMMKSLSMSGIVLAVLCLFALLYPVM